MMTLWKQVGPWTFDYFAPDEDLEQLRDFEPIVSRWLDKRRDRRVPAWADFDMVDFKGWHGNLIVYEISYDPFDWKIRLSGTNVDVLFQRVLTGLDREGLYENSIEKDDSCEFYEMISRELFLARTTGPLNIKQRDFRQVNYLELPLSDDGIQATHSIELVLPTS